MSYNMSVDLGLKGEAGLKLLAEQKLVLVELQAKVEDKNDADKLLGLMHFIDHIQDTLVDDNGIPQEIVFPFMDKDNNEY